MNDDLNPKGDVQATYDLAAQTFVEQQPDLEDGSALIFAHKDMTPHKFPSLNPPLPDFVTQAESFIEPASMIGYIERFKTPTTICIAALANTTITAFLDYHEASNGVAAAPGRNRHKVTLTAPYDADYARWKKIFGMQVPQLELGEFLEEMLHTIAHPEGGALMDTINTISINRSVAVRSAVNTRSGTIKLTFDESDAADVELPREIKLVMPVFAGTEPVEITAKIRYRLPPGQRGAVNFVLMVPGLDKIERDQFRAIGDDIADQCAIPVFYSA